MKCTDDFFDQLNMSFISSSLHFFNKFPLSYPIVMIPVLRQFPFHVVYIYSYIHTYILDDPATLHCGTVWLHG
jgi:hypothetical protein